MNERIISGVQKRLDSMQMSPEKKKVMLLGTGAVFEECMDLALDALQEQYDGVETYLEKELGVGKRERAILQSKYLQ